MTSQHDKAKRWRPRFSVRTLAVVVTLVCCYFASWQATRSLGNRDVEAVRVVDTVESPAPFIVITREGLIEGWLERQPSITARVDVCRYYFWFFGYVGKMYEREVTTYGI